MSPRFFSPRGSIFRGLASERNRTPKNCIFKPSTANKAAVITIATSGRNFPLALLLLDALERAWRGREHWVLQLDNQPQERATTADKNKRRQQLQTRCNTTTALLGTDERGNGDGQEGTVGADKRR